MNDTVVRTRNTPALTLGIAASVLAILALVVGWIPVLGLLSLPVGAIALLLAIVGVLISVVSGFRGVAMPLLGCLLSAAAIGLPLVSTVATTGAIVEGNRAMAEARAEFEAEAAAAAAAAVVPWGQVGTFGELQISITDISVGPAQIQDLFSGTPRTTNRDVLRVEILAHNPSESRKIDFYTWRDSSGLLVTDDHGNEYTDTSGYFSEKPVGGIHMESIYPGDSVSDVLLLEPPVSSATTLLLTLPGRRGADALQFSIPISAVTR